MKNLKTKLSSELFIFVLLSASVSLYVISSLFVTSDSVKLIIDILAITSGLLGSLSFFFNEENLSAASDEEEVLHV